MRNSVSIFRDRGYVQVPYLWLRESIGDDEGATRISDNGLIEDSSSRLVTGSATQIKCGELPTNNRDCWSGLGELDGSTYREFPDFWR